MTKTLLLAVTFAGALLAAAPAGAQITIDIDVFHDRLSPYGRWVDHDDFGRVWSPYRRDWRPYSEGRWVYTEDYGWLWIEEDDWGWATEHYGRWFYDRRQGWLWLPGFEWAPAWVSWRSAPDYIGWAPLAPRGWRYDDDYDRRRWRFVRGDRFLAPNVRTVLIEPSRHTWLLERVPVKGEVRHSRGRWENRALDTAFVERVTREKVKRVRVRDLERAQRPSVESDSVAVFRPEVRERDRSEAKGNEREQSKQREQSPERAKARTAEPREPKAKPAERAPKAAPEPEGPPVERSSDERNERKSVDRKQTGEARKDARPPAAARAEKPAQAPQPKAAPQRQTERSEPRREAAPQARKQAKPEPRAANEPRNDDRPPAKSKSKGKASDDEKQRGRSAEDGG